MVYTEIDFEWDENKNLANFRKHGISFEQAVFTFFDPDAFIESDIKHSSYEAREYVIGKTMLGHIFVVYTIRVTVNKVRIISARKTTEREKLGYEKNKRI